MYVERKKMPFTNDDIDEDNNIMNFTQNDVNQMSPTCSINETSGSR